MRRFLGLSVLTLALLGCQPERFDADGLSQEFTPEFRVPHGWPAPHYQFQSNPLTRDGYKLGRRLFYEPMLSRDNTISCGSCHQQSAGFAHAQHTLSHGIDGLFGIRNSPGLFNLAWHPSFMWDGGINHIEVQPLAPITNPVEMGDSIQPVLAKLQASTEYRDLFTAAFGDDRITSQRMFYALVQFMGAMISDQSKYDRVMRGESPGGFSDEEQRGLILFRQKCSTCHTEPLFSDFSFRNNGLAISALLQDSGRAHITQLPQDRYKFKVPSLRNVAVTAPYMHDGRFATLRQCIEHYRDDIQPTPNLDPSLQYGIAMTDQEVTAIESFLRTLTDYPFQRDRVFAEPR